MELNASGREERSMYKLVYLCRHGQGFRAYDVSFLSDLDSHLFLCLR